MARIVCIPLMTGLNCMSLNKLTIKQKLLLTSVSFLLVSILSMGIITYFYETAEFEEEFNKVAQTQSQIFYNNLSNEAEDMSGIHAALSHIESLLTPFAKRDRAQLLTNTQPLFNQFRQTCKITHMYFITPDGTVFLRVHKPEQSGDVLQRDTFLRASKNHSLASGLELGLNFFSLRSVNPVFSSGKLLGYFEIAKEIDHIFEGMKKNSGYDFAVFLNKDFLQKHATVVTGPLVGPFEILYPTDKYTAEKLAHRINTAHRQPLDFRVSLELFDGKKIYMGVSPLHDSAGNLVGRLVSFKDITAKYAQMWHRIAMTSITFATLILLVHLLVAVFTRKSRQQLFGLHSHMIEVSKTLEMPDKIPVSSSDEIGSLAVAFNSMISALEKQRSDLSEQLSFRQSLIETVPIPIFYKDLQGRYLGCNEGFVRLLGLEKEQIIGRIPSDVAPPEKAELYRQKDRELLERNTQVQTYESTIISAAGVCYDVVFYKAPYYDSLGNLAGLVGSILDITEQKKHIRTLLESENRFKSLFDNIVDAVFVHDHDGTILDVNATAIDRLGYSRDEFKNMNIRDIAVPEDIPAMQVAFQNAAKQGLHQLGAMRARNGTIIPVEISSKGFDFNGKKMLIGLARDMTEKNRLETERQLLELQLRQAHKLEAIGSLAGGIAHDFNNKLTVILGHVYMSLNGANPKRQRESLEQIKKAAEQSAELTHQLLAFASKQVFVPKVLDLNDTVESMLKMLKRLIGENVILTWKSSPDPCLISFDPSQIDQIMTNLCINARDAISNTGTITIETGNRIVDTEHTSHNPDALPGRYVVLTVSDNGSGMGSETLEHIFEPFFTTKDKGKGTGLGLATVFGIVKQNRGFIDIFSELGTGTTFTIFIPQCDGAPSLENQDTRGSSSLSGHETILLVEDEPDILDIATRMLEKQGYTVLRASGPGEAMALAKEHDGGIHLLITDVIMPEMNGRDLANALTSGHTQLKCLFMSGYSADIISQHGILDEGVHFISKPFSQPELVSQVREVLDGNQNGT